MNADNLPNLEPSPIRVNRAHEFRRRCSAWVAVLVAVVPAAAFGQAGTARPKDDSTKVIARGKGLTVSLGAYQRYLVARFGTVFVSDMIYELLLERECARLGLAKHARERAAKLAAEEPAVPGLPVAQSRRLRARNHLHRLRVAALVQKFRDPNEKQLRHEFDVQFGVDGRRVVIRQIQVSLIATRRQLERARKRPASDTEVATKAKQRIDALRAELDAGASFTKLLAKSDDPTTRTLLQSPRFRDQAGFVPNYNYQRFGVAFAEAVRKLAPGEVSQPVRSSYGWHIIELVSRKTTKFEDVREQLVHRYRDAPVRIDEDKNLRERLFRRYEVELDVR